MLREDIDFWINLNQSAHTSIPFFHVRNVEHHGSLVLLYPRHLKLPAYAE